MANYYDVVRHILLVQCQFLKFTNQEGGKLTYRSVPGNTGQQLRVIYSELATILLSYEYSPLGLTTPPPKTD